MFFVISNTASFVSSSHLGSSVTLSRARTASDAILRAWLLGGILGVGEERRSPRRARKEVDVCSAVREEVEGRLWSDIEGQYIF